MHRAMTAMWCLGQTTSREDSPKSLTVTARVEQHDGAMTRCIRLSEMKVVTLFT